jgi:tRNA 2-thiocytidine biosynthesis protein TtcA
VKEQDLERYAHIRQFPIIPCDLCGSQDQLQRRQVKGMLREWDKRFPGRIESMFNALADVRLSHLMDRARFDFAGLRPQDMPFENGDLAFDEELPQPAVTPLRRADAA